jgi:hypothetical protein
MFQSNGDAMNTLAKCERRNMLAVLGLALPALLLSGGPNAWAGQGKGKKERHPHIHHALRELREAKKELETAAHDFGGHRVDAIQAIDEAIKQLELALKFDKK